MDSPTIVMVTNLKEEDKVESDDNYHPVHFNRRKLAPFTHKDLLF